MSNIQENFKPNVLSSVYRVLRGIKFFALRGTLTQKI